MVTVIKYIYIAMTYTYIGGSSQVKRNIPLHPLQQFYKYLCSSQEKSVSNTINVEDTGSVHTVIQQWSRTSLAVILWAGSTVNIPSIQFLAETIWQIVNNGLQWNSI